MIDTHLNLINDDDPALKHARLTTCAMKILQYLSTHQRIGLTKSKAFNRKFVEWAAEAFQWPGYEPDELYQYNKVLDEPDLPPLELLHWLLFELKLIRHIKLDSHLTRKGAALLDRPGALFNQITPFYLFRLDHASLYRSHRESIGSITHFLLAIHQLSDTETPITADMLRHALFGRPEPGMLYDEIASQINYEVLSPLEWAGLLVRNGSETSTSHVSYLQTPLWTRAVGLASQTRLRLVSSMDPTDGSLTQDDKP